MSRLAPALELETVAAHALGETSLVIAVRDPVGTGLIASLVRPGGNVTGVSGYAGLEIVAKQLGLLKETIPRIRRVAILLLARLSPRQSRPRPSRRERSRE